MINIDWPGDSLYLIAKKFNVVTPNYIEKREKNPVKVFPLFHFRSEESS